MFNSLSIRNSPLNKKVDIRFEKGINVLKGKNSSGKSTVIEMLNYVLFGSVALRSSMSTYNKDFKVEAELSINNIDYKVIRTVKDSQIYFYDLKEKQYLILATGITPVNDYLKGILSYDYKIFSLTNFCKQHELLKLTSCSPAQLVNLIEVISGLDSSYKLMLSLKESKKEAKTVISSLTFTLTNASKVTSDFIINEDYEKLLKEDTETLSYLEDVKNKNSSVLSSLEYFRNSVTKNVKEYNKTESKIETLQALLDSDVNLDNYEEVKSQIQNLDINISKVKSKIDSIDNLDTLYTEEYLNEQEILNDLNLQYSHYLKIKEKLDSHTITCPNCEHTFHDLDLEVDVSFEEAPDKPMLSSKAILKHRVWITKESEYKALKVELEALNESRKYLPTLSKIEANFSIIKDLVEAKRVKSYIEESIKTSYLDYSNLSFDFNNIEKSVKELNTRVETNSNIYKKDLEAYIDFKDYVSNKKFYLEKKELLQSLETELDKNRENLEIYSILYDVLIDVKKKIQTESFPILNSVASNILSQITGGERNSVYITEDFKIEVDGTDIDTVEGSGKVITNLALRVAMLSTFYKDTFLVCLFDEIDESLHEDRFEFMQECFDNLSNQGYQLILTSHKDYNVDNIINMDTFNND